MVIRFAEWLFAYGKMIISLRENDNRLRRMIICLRQNKGEFPSLAARKFSFLLEKQQRKSFSQVFSKTCGFSRQSLESRAAERETLSALQAGGAPADRLEGVKSPLAGDFRSFTPPVCRSPRNRVPALKGAATTSGDRDRW